LPTGAEPADIGVAAGKIAAIGAPGSPTAISAVQTTVDAEGLIVIPGGIDPHVHCRWPVVVPGTTQHQMTERPARVSEVALFGGTTTIIDFALVGDGDTVQQAIERRQWEWAGDCHCDYAFHTMMQGKLAPESLPQLADEVAAGHPSVKIFTTDITPSRRAAWSTSVTSRRCSRSWRKRAGSPQFTPKITTSSCTCAGQCPDFLTTSFAGMTGDV
jgi:dihydropyrimidinase